MKIKRVHTINQSRALMVSFSFSTLCRKLKDDSTIEDLKALKPNAVGEVGFKEFLSVITSVEWKEEKLTKKEKGALSLINEYLNEDLKQDEQDVVMSKGVSFLDIIKAQESEEE